MIILTSCQFEGALELGIIRRTDYICQYVSDGRIVSVWECILKNGSTCIIKEVGDM